MISLGKIVPKITRQLITFYLDGKEMGLTGQR